MAEKDLVWIGSSLMDLEKFPAEIQRMVGTALHWAQVGAKHPDAKPMKGFKGAGVLEIVEDHDGDTYRAVYTVTLGDVVPSHQVASEDREGSAHGESIMTQGTKSSGNVFADLGLDKPEELLAKAKLALEISRILERRGLTQAKAAEILGVDPAKVSALVRGRLTGFSTDRLLRFLVALGHDVEITVKRKPPSRRPARIKVEGA